MFLFATLLFSFVFYAPTLSFFFISDDFDTIVKYRHFLDLVKIGPYDIHYSPVIRLINFFLTQFAWPNPTLFHFLSVAIHLVNIYLVYKLANIFIKDKLRSNIAALIFAFFFGAYEVIYWYAAINNSLLVTYYLAAIIFFIDYIKSKKTLSLILFEFSFLLAFFTHEYAISLIPVAFIYWFINTRLKNFKTLIKIFTIPIVVLFATTIFKMIYVKMPLFVRTPTLAKFIAYFLRSVVYLFVPNPYIVDRLPNFAIPIVFIIISLVLVRYTRNKKALFLLIWGFLTIFLYSITSAPQARYFYLSYIPIAVYILLIINFKKRKSLVIGGVYLMFILTSGLIFLQNQKVYWKLNSKITKNVIVDLKKIFANNKNTDIIYFVNLPDSVNDSIWKAYVFRSGFIKLLNLSVNIYPKKVIFLTSYRPSKHVIEASYMSSQELISLSKNNQVFIYNEDSKTIKPLH